MLNPSTADAYKEDPTVRRCINFAAREKCGSLTVVNLYALRSSKPEALHKAADPVGWANDITIRTECRGADLIVCAWGGFAGPVVDRGDHVVRMLKGDGNTLHRLGTTKAGHPLHPLYIHHDTPLEPL
jgi:hypothetical protein